MIYDITRIRILEGTIVEIALSDKVTRRAKLEKDMIVKVLDREAAKLIDEGKAEYYSGK